MPSKLITLFAVVLSSYSFGSAQSVAPKRVVTDTYFGRTVEDPYRYMENLEDPFVVNWLKEQTVHARTNLDGIAGRQRLIDKQLEIDLALTDAVSHLCTTVNGHYFYLRTLSAENSTKLYHRMGLNGEEKELFDTRTYKAASGNKYVINYIQPDWKGARIVISLSKNGEEISEMVIYDLRSGSLLPNITISNCWPSDGGGVSWLPDNSGFIYLHYPVTDPASEGFLKNMKAVVYKLGDDPKKLNQVFSKENNPELAIEAHDFPIVTLQHVDDKWAIGGLYGATPYGDTYYADIKGVMALKPKWNLLFKQEDKVASYVLDGKHIIYMTAKNSPHYQICKTSLEKPDLKNPEILVEASEHEVITGFALTKDGLYFVRQKNGVEASLYALRKSGIEKITTPESFGTIRLNSFQRSSSDLWITASGWTSPARRYKYDPIGNRFEVADLNKRAVIKDFEGIISEEVVVKSHDGTEVPLSLIYKKGIKKDGNNPVLIYGYGAYGMSATPTYHLPFLLWAMEGGVVAVAHVRGGGEKGDAWHQGGLKKTKPNTWKDAIACAEYMIKEKFTSPEHQAIHAISAGGIMIGRAITERPDLFAVAIPEVGALNPLRGENSPNGANDTKEYGSVANEEEFLALVEMDAYSQIKEGVAYPATLVTTGINDPRVIPWQPAKFAARLQSANISKKPVMFLVDFEGGHGLDITRRRRIEHIADVMSFAFWQTGHLNYQKK